MADPPEPLEPAEVPRNLVAFPEVRDHQLIRLIGAGSSGEVWLAKNALGTCRAVKIIYERTFRHRRPFDREFNGVLNVEPLSRLHDGLVDILQVGRNDAAGYFYYVMELADDEVRGPDISPDDYRPHTLSSDVGAGRRLPVARCILYGSAIASALSFLHKHGLTHRDIKPSNIIFVHGLPKLADIGLVAELAEAKSYVGTEGFIPPEGPGSVPADIYSLGKVLYEISTGKDRNDYPELPPQLEENAEGRNLVQFNKIILKACRANPRQRFKSAEELMTELVTFQFSEEDPAREHLRQVAVRVIGVLGILVGFGVIIVLLARLLWLLNHTG